MSKFLSTLCLLVYTALLTLPAHAAAKPSLLHVSYDATRELLRDYNKDFIKKYQAEYDVKPRIRMSHGSSGKQARGVLDGLRADIVSLALSYDLDQIAKAGLLPENWQKQLPQKSSPFYSTIVLLVRKGNPKNIRGWEDLARKDVSVLTPNPKTSGGARWGYLAAWAHARARYKNNQKREDFMCRWIQNVPFWDTAARAATTSFIRRRKGDVLIAWENEAYVARKFFGEDAFEVVVPKITIRAEPKLAILQNDKRSDAQSAFIDRYVKGLYAPDAQAMIAQHFFRPYLKKYDKILPRFKRIRFVNIQKLGGFAAMQKQHFAEGALFDRCTAAKHTAKLSGGDS
jgi:sulfate transport system substrate-binding protein